MKTLLKIPIPSFLIALILALACIGRLPRAQAVSPAPDGAYPNFTTAEGQNALQDLTSGAGNTALGAYSLFSTTTTSFNTAVGAGALDLNTGDANTAVGVAALLLNAGTQNTAVGVDALFGNTTGLGNTADGFEALFSNNVGQFNTADGFGALDRNTTGNANTAIGGSALESSTVGNNNTAIGDLALSASVSGSNNIGLGFNAGTNVVTASGVICIGAGLNGEDVSNTCFIDNIFATTTISGNTLPVIVSDGGQLGTASSSRRFKKEIKPMDKASEAILALKPVTFQYKSDKTTTPQFGLVAEDVAEVNPNLVVRDKNGEIYTVRYDAVNAMLLNEFLKEHQTVQELKKQIAELTAGLQKVSAQLEVSKPAPQTVLNNQ